MADQTVTPDLSTLPHDDAGPIIIAVLWMLCAVSGLFLVLRVWCKFRTHRGLWWDDYILIASWVCLVGHAVAWNIGVVVYNYGKHSWDITNVDDVAGIFLVLSISGVFILVAIIWSKTAFGVTLLRLAEGWMMWTVWFCIITTNLVLGVSILLNFIRCKPVSATWNIFVQGECWPTQPVVYYHIFAAGYSALMDIVLACLPWKLVMGLQMKRREKAGVAVAMSMGVFAGIASITKATTLTAINSFDFYDGITIVYWGAAEASITIVAASIPVLRVLVRHVQTTTRKYYKTEDDTISKPHGGRNHTIVTSTRQNMSRVEKSDIVPLTPAGGRVVMTNEVAISYQYSEGKGGNSGVYEVGNAV